MSLSAQIAADYVNVHKRMCTELSETDDYEARLKIVRNANARLTEDIESCVPKVHWLGLCVYSDLYTFVDVPVETTIDALLRGTHGLDDGGYIAWISREEDAEYPAISTDRMCSFAKPTVATLLAEAGIDIGDLEDKVPFYVHLQFDDDDSDDSDDSSDDDGSSAEQYLGEWKTD